jgi:beta-lactamase regulating signal transducer with metallopeptidase domain
VSSDNRKGLSPSEFHTGASAHNLNGLPVPKAGAENPAVLTAKVIWSAGSLLILAGVVFSRGRMSRRIRRERPLTNSGMLDLLQDCKEEMGVHTPLTLIETRAVESPVLYGFLRPRLLLPSGLSKKFSDAEMRHIFLHELGHLKRGDIQLNWITTLLLVLHWFNPWVWFAISRMRLDRELACDALALSYSKAQKPYGETILKLVEQFSRPGWGPAIVGIVEDKNQIKQRIKMILKFKQAKHWPALAVALFAALGLMTLTEAQSPQTAAQNSDKPNRLPRIIATVPAIGATEVDPALTEITVTFDLDMAGGFSWTGGGPDYPVREGEKPRWRDRRTCVLPVKLEAAHYYRVGINSQSHQNFRSVAGVSATPTAFYFTTQGASGELKAKTKKPEIVELNPPNGAKEVDPNTKELRVTFNVPMGGGFSWTGSGPQVPSAPEGKRPYWTPDRKTCVMPVDLKPGIDYHVGLNSVSHKNFQSAAGIPLDPITYRFKTKQAP